ncbi:MAG: hypothetical protein Kow0077_08750 [Anaerolineae bacterium]
MLSIRLAKMADVRAIQRLNQQQAKRLAALDPRLPASVVIPSWLLLAEGGAGWVACEGEELVGALSVEPEEWPPHSPFANVFPRRYLRMRLILGDAADPAAVIPALMARANGWLGVAPDFGRMLLHPLCDTAVSDVLEAEGFAPYHIIASQPMPAYLPDSDVPGLEISAATRHDVHAVAVLMAESWRFHAAYQPAIVISPHILEGCERQTRQMLGDGIQRVMLVARLDGEVVGFFGIGLSAQDAHARPALFATGYYGDIYEVGVRGDLRRQGIGRALFAAAWRWFSIRNVRGMLVNYAPTNPLSSRFWPAMGFKDAWVNWWRA